MNRELLTILQELRINKEELNEVCHKITFNKPSLNQCTQVLCRNCIMSHNAFDTFTKQPIDEYILTVRSLL